MSRRLSQIMFSTGLFIAITASSGKVLSELPTLDGVPTANAEDVGMSSSRLARLDRAMQGYENALIGGDTSGILSPDSEFFKFFGNIKPKQ